MKGFKNILRVTLMYFVFRFRGARRTLRIHEEHNVKRKDLKLLFLYFR